MPRAVSMIEVKDRLDALLDDVERGDEVIVEREGEPAAVLVSFAAYQEVAALRERQRRADALVLLEQVAERARARDADLTEEQAIELADRISHEIVDDLAARGAVAFERDRR